MDTQRDKVRKQAVKSKSTKRKDKKYKSGKVFRRKSLKSLGNFMNRILKTLGTLAHFGDVESADIEDDDGGFRDSTLSANSGNLKEDLHGARGNTLKKSTPSSFHGSVKDRLSWCYGDKTPGVLGLKNHGNTCFMNAVVQCLSNTDLLAEYLGLEQYKYDLGLSQKRINGIVKNTELVSAKGEVTDHLASLVRALWTLEYTPQLSVEFKSIVSKYGSQFRGNSQHDALEFLLWLLDRVHEDANSTPNNNNNTKSRTTAMVQTGSDTLPTGGPVKSQQPGTRYSFVQEHFQAQYRSSLTCPHCLKQSNTFDPFLCISLPIPLRQTRPLNVTLVFSTKGQRYLRVGLAAPLLGTVATLRGVVAEEGKISPGEVILTEIYPTGFQRSFSDDDDLTSIADGDVIYAFQAPPLYTRGGSARFSGYHHSLPSSPYSSGSEGHRLPPSGTLSSEFLNQGITTTTSKLLLLICNTAGSGQQAVRFGPPFLIREDRSLSWDQFQQSLLSKLYYLMLNGTQAQSGSVLFRIRVVSGTSSHSYLSPQDNRPLCHPAVDRALKLCGQGGPAHVKLIIEWDQKLKECLFGNIQEEVVKDAESVRLQQHNHLQQHSCTLDECFQLYTKEEQLAPDDAWKCPHCQQLQQGTVKMSLWTLPDILILHLKRFRQVAERRNKLTTLVHFPPAGLDMAPHVVQRNHGKHTLGPWSAHAPDGTLPEDFLYDLYAVCNHHGGMHGGHYTAYCKNSVDGQWYCYDDSSVDLVPEEELSTRGAYILFYQRRNAIPPWSANSSIRGSTSSSVSDHWLLRLAGESKRGSVVSRSSTTCPSSIADSPTSPESPGYLETPPREGRESFEGQTFVRGLKGRSASVRTPSKAREALSRVLPLRWSFSSKGRRKIPSTSESSTAPCETRIPAPAAPPVELVEYLESGRRPRFTKDSIVKLVSGQDGPKGQQPQSGNNTTASSSSSLSCVGRTSEEATNPVKVPEGQHRHHNSDRSTKTVAVGALRRSITNINDIAATTRKQHQEHFEQSGREGDTLGRRTGRWTSQDQPSRSHDSHSRRGSSSGVLLPSHSTSSSPHTSTSANRSRGKVRDVGVDEEHQGPMGRDGTHKSDDSKDLFSFLKGGFLKRESMRRSRDGHLTRGSSSSDAGSRSLSKLSLTNGGPGSGSSNHHHNHRRHHGDELANGKVVRGSMPDINRSQSSSNIQSKGDPLRRTASLHRNGLTSTQPSQASSSRSLATTAEKNSYGTLQRSRYSSTSLGRKRTVPESSF